MCLFSAKLISKLVHCVANESVVLCQHERQSAAGWWQGTWKDVSSSSTCPSSCLWSLNGSLGDPAYSVSPQTLAPSQVRRGERASESGSEASLDGSAVTSKPYETAFTKVPAISSEIIAFWWDENKNSWRWLLVAMKSFPPSAGWVAIPPGHYLCSRDWGSPGHDKSNLCCSWWWKKRV